MANIMIEVRVGNQQLKPTAGFRLYFSNGDMNSKMPPKYISELVSTAIEKELKYRNIDLYELNVVKSKKVEGTQ